MRILLVSPACNNDVHREVLSELPFLGRGGFFAPHACAVVASLTPRAHEVRIHDENLHGPVDGLLASTAFDIVGISLITTALERTRAIAELFRAAGRHGLLVAGGSCVLHMLPRLTGIMDVVFVGEAEETWPTFLKELAEGRHQSVYRQIAKPDLSKVPAPRWELIGGDISRYAVASVQTKRGCPNDCSFCDVVYTFGRKVRRKSTEQVLDEVRLLARLGCELVFFADDNFAADPRHAKELLRGLVELNRSLETRISFSTQAEISVAQDLELLQLMLDANVLELQIGIESTSAASLEDISKSPNLRIDLVEAIKTIQSYGIVVLAHTIVGIDSDDPSVFAELERFVRDAHVVHHGCHMLMAPPGTKLWRDLKRAGRLVAVSDQMFGEMMAEMSTNIIPKQMSRLELMEGLATHLEAVTRPEHFLERARGFVRGIAHRPSFAVHNDPSVWQLRNKLFQLLRYYLLRASRADRRVFLKLVIETARTRPDLIARVIYAIVCHQIEHSQAKPALRRQIAARERGEPALIRRLDSTEEIAEGFLRNAEQIIATAYQRVRQTIGDRDTLYRAVVEAVVDCHERHGEHCDPFDEEQREAVRESCDVIVNRIRTDAPAEGEVLAEEPPPGFTREIVDAMDQTMRFIRAPREM